MDDRTDAATPAPDGPQPGAPDRPPAGERGPDQHEVAAAVERLLVAQGPLTAADLATAFETAEPALAEVVRRDPGASLADRLQRLIGPDERFWRLTDGRITPIRHHLRRTTVTHRLSAGEIARSALDLVPDVIAISPQRPFRLADGTELATATSDTDERAAETGSALGPPGWLDRFEPGTLLTFRYDGEVGHLEPLPATATLADLATAERAAAAIEQAYRAGSGAKVPDVQQVVIDAIAADPDAFTADPEAAVAPLPPVAELLASVGLRLRLIWLGPADRPWAHPPEQSRNARARELLASADRCCQQAAARALDAWNAWLEVEAEGAEPRPEAEPTAKLATDIDHGIVAGVLAELATAGRPILTRRRMGRWAEAAAAAHGGPPLAGIEFLRSVAEDAAGDALAAEARMRAVLERDPGHVGALLFLAEFAADRGDAETVLSIASRAERMPSDAALLRLAPFVVTRSVGRNEPCPCGSGRKYKVCCSGKTLRRPLPLRARWLLQRAGDFAGRRNVAMARRVQAMLDPMSDFGTSEVPMSEQSGILARDVVVFDDGLASYLDVRGPLLAADELACARGWLGAPLRLLEITANVPGIDPADGDPTGTVIEAVDVGTGATRTIVAVPPAHAEALPPGTLAIARLLPVDDVWILGFAVLPLSETPRRRAEELAAADIDLAQLMRTVFEVQMDAMSAASPPFPLGDLSPLRPGTSR